MEMRTSLKYILLMCCLIASVVVEAQDSDDFDSNINTTDKWKKWGPSSSSGFGLIGRIGYSIGGTSPIPIPAEIRKIESFSPQGGISFGVEAYKMFNKRWGLRVGFTFAYQGFKTRALVKDYYTKIVKDGEEQLGWYTGHNATDITCWTFVVPITATFRISPRWNVSAGPYLLVNMSKDFNATVSDGYLRRDYGKGPTDVKVDPSTVTASLGDDMRRCGMGIQLGFDWKVMRHIGAFAKLDWGLTSIFPSDYKTVTFKMYPVYGTIGAFYSF